MGMFNVVMKNLFGKKRTRQFPLGAEREPFERSRGHIEMNPDNCILCSLCARKCPADAITVDRATGKWELNNFRCIICGECTTSCPKKCITMSNERRHGSVSKPVTFHHVEPPKPAPKPAAPPVQKPVQTEATEAKPASDTAKNA